MTATHEENVVRQRRMSFTRAKCNTRKRNDSRAGRNDEYRPINCRLIFQRRTDQKSMHQENSPSAGNASSV